MADKEVEISKYFLSNTPSNGFCSLPKAYHALTSAQVMQALIYGHIRTQF
jgi:hypothetical protein